MAKVVPEGWRELAAIGAALREIETLSVLADDLSDDYRGAMGRNQRGADRWIIRDATRLERV